MYKTKTLAKSNSFDLSQSGVPMDFFPTVEINVANYIDVNYDEYQYLRLKLVGCWDTSSLMELDKLLKDSLVGDVILDMMETQATRLVGFYSCTPIVEVLIGSGVRQLGSGAPYNRISRALDSHQIRKHSAFCSCQNLRKITVAPGVESIGCLCFWMTPRLQEVTVGAKKLSQDLFRLSQNIRKLNLEGVEKIEKWCFSKNRRLESVVIPDSVKSMRASFQSCSSLKTVELGDGLTTISRSAFYDCGVLEKISLGRNITCIAEGAFEECSSLSEINIPEGLTEIKSEAFLNCTSLRKIHIPLSLTRIEKDAFRGCSALDAESVQAIREAGYQGEF